MEKDFEIEVQGENSTIADNIQLPINFKQIGEIENDDVKVYIHQNVYYKIEEFARSNIAKELGSILIGQTTNDIGKTHVVISNYIEAKYTDASASTLTFTHETWDYVHKEHETNYPQLKILGWQHTHPNYGIFLSNYDMFIQENFFNLPFQIAYVVDPIQNLRGFFQWKNGRVEKLKGFYIYDDVGNDIKIEDKSSEEKANVQRTLLPKGIYMAILLVFLAVLIGMGYSIGVLGRKLKVQKGEQQALELELESMRQVLEAENGDNQKSENNQTDDSADYESDIIKLKQDIESLERIVCVQNEEIEALKAKGAETDISEGIVEPNRVSFILHKVSEGDSLSSICEEHKIDYYANYRIIMALNDIQDSDHIYAGQNLLLPVNVID